MMPVVVSRFNLRTETEFMTSRRKRVGHLTINRQRSEKRKIGGVGKEENERGNEIAS